MNEMKERAKEGLDELARRTAMLDAIGYAATQIIAAPDWRSGIPELLDRLGHATEVSRVTLFEVHDGPQGNLVQSCRYDWAEPGLASLSSDPRYQDMNLADEDRPGELGEWSRRRQRGEVVQATLRELSGYARQVFIEHGTVAFVSVPIMLGTLWWGFLGFDDCRQDRVWSPLEIDVLKTAGALIAGAVERGRAGERLRVSEERYAMAARGANDGLWDWDIARAEAYFSPRLHEILNLDDGVLKGSMAALYPHLLPQDAEALRAGIAERIERRRAKFEFECRTHDKGQGSRWLILRGLITYGEGGPRRIVGGLRDITRRKEMEARLQESEARARAVVSGALDAIVSIDEEGRIIEFNPAAERMFGHRLNEVVERPLHEVIIPPTYREGHIEGLNRYLTSGESRMLGRRVETVALHADGRMFPIEMAVSAVQLRGRRLFTAFLRDITERREFQSQLTEVERKRASLARYFSPNMVDELMQTGGDLDTARLQMVAVLFVDMIGFTRISARLRSVEVIGLLREFLGFFEEAVFAHGGTLDKYLGDGLMATFGTPRPGPKDASNAIACAVEMARQIVIWNAHRQSAGLEELRIGIGVHYGEVVLGDIGGERRMEFAVVGDTVNIASRIQDMTRQLGLAILASDAIVQAADREGSPPLLAEFRDLGEHELRGRTGKIRLWGREAESGISLS
jgi:PAS domain S-box-containing protein